MFYATQASIAQKNTIDRPQPNGSVILRRPYFGAPPAGLQNAEVAKSAHSGKAVSLEPQAFMVEQKDGSVLGAHFHFVDQFQLVVDGSGSIGRHPVKPFSVHFSTAGTGYGPITPGPGGLRYLTLRASSDSSGAQYLPESRVRQPSGVRRNVVFDDIRADQFSAAPISNNPQILIEEPGGLAIVLSQLEPEQSDEWKGEYEGRGQSIVVLCGNVKCRGENYEPLSVIFASSEEGPVRIQAGERSAALLIMQFPRSGD